MKKKGLILLTFIAITGLLLGTVNISASETERKTTDIAQYEKHYNSDLVDGDAQLGALPAVAAFVGSVLFGGTNAHRVASSGKDEIVSQKVKYIENTDGTDGFHTEFGR